MKSSQDRAWQPTHYQIRLEGHLDLCWSDWFDCLCIAHQTDGTTLLSGPVADQAALLGLLMRVHNLGLCLLAVIRSCERPVP